MGGRILPPSIYDLDQSILTETIPESDILLEKAPTKVLEVKE